jgi:hypothetical protein
MAFPINPSEEASAPERLRNTPCESFFRGPVLTATGTAPDKELSPASHRQELAEASI